MYTWLFGTAFSLGFILLVAFTELLSKFVKELENLVNNYRKTKPKQKKLKSHNAFSSIETSQNLF